MSVSWMMLLNVIAIRIDEISAISITSEIPLEFTDYVLYDKTTDLPIDQHTTLPTTAYDHMDIGCNYINTKDIAIPTNACHLSIYDGMQQSYMYQCNNNGQYPSSNTPIVLLFWPHSDCYGIDSIVIDVTDITDYSCAYNDTYNDECIDNQLFITQYHHPDPTETCVYNENYMFIETQIINKCIKAWDASVYIEYKCNGDEISIDYYVDTKCTEWISRNKTIRNNDCIDGTIIQHSCSATQIPDTTQITNDIECDYVNYDGFARRIDVCHPAPYKGFVYEYYTLQCNDPDDIETDGVVSVAWWGHNGCIDDPLRTYPLNTEYDIIDYKCSSSNVSNICPTEDVLILQKFDDTDCVKDDTAYHMVDIMLNTCVKDGYGGAKKVLCELDHEQQQAMGYKITNYKDENCEYLLTEESYEVIECPDNDRLQFVIWCDGANEIEYFDETCEYFINNEHLNHERKYLIHALNKCSEFTLNGGYFSNQYVCDSDNTGVHEIWYKGKRCEDENEIGRHNFDDNKNNFNCYHGLVSNEDDEGCDVDNALLTLRWYIKDPLNKYGDCIKKKGFHQDNYIITGICVPDYVNEVDGYSIYTMIQCDDHHLYWYEIGYYSDSKCSNKLDGLRFKSGQCFNGDIVDIKGCKGKGDEYSDYMDSSSSSSSSSDVLPVVVVNEM